MKRKWVLLLTALMVLSLLVNGFAYAKHPGTPGRQIDPVVTTDWLLANGGLNKLVVIDIRSSAEYLAGHIANSINAPFEVPFCAWLAMRGDVLLELPDDQSLFNTIGACGITRDSQVVLITSMANPPFPLANATRVAATLIYAGVKNVAVLDGGFPKWVAENKPVTTVIPAVVPVTYQGAANQEMWVTIDYVKKHLGKSLIIDARDVDVYFGITLESWANKAGHIPTARSLPTLWMWNADGTYKETAVLKEMAAGVIDDCNARLFDRLKDEWKFRSDKEEIIIYCGLGGYETSWWFVLTQMLGYDNVKLFDGAAQEWVNYYDMTKFTWE